MLRRKRVKSDSQEEGARRRGGRLREAFVDFGWALREHLLWRPLDALRSLRERAKSPFEAAAWKLRRGVWRVEDRTDFWSPATRGLAVGALVLMAAGAGVSGLLFAAPERSGEPGTPTVSAAPAPTAVATQVVVPEPKPEPREPTLQGAAPIFSSSGHAEEPAGGKQAKGSSGKGTAKASDSEETAEKQQQPTGEQTPLPTVLSSNGRATVATTSSAASKPAGPKAVKVARQFAKAFVLYETGRVEPEVRKAFAETATPELRKALLRRPPRQPANVEVPKAKVLNVVPGPSRDGVYTVSVSLLRVGLTSELRLDMEPGKGKRWQVTDVLG